VVIPEYVNVLIDTINSNPRMYNTTQDMFKIRYIFSKCINMPFRALGRFCLHITSGIRTY